MKKFLAIPLLILVLFSGATFNIATHYCNGIVADRTVNLSGKLPTCGMEDNDNHQSGITLTRHHCQNVASSYTLCNTYVTASAVTVGAISQFVHNAFAQTILTSPEPSVAVKSILNRPPGVFNPDNVDLELVCVFRI